MKRGEPCRDSKGGLSFQCLVVHLHTPGPDYLQCDVERNVMFLWCVLFLLCVLSFTGNAGVTFLTPCRVAGVCLTVVLLGGIGAAVWAVGEISLLLLSHSSDVYLLAMSSALWAM